MKKLINIFLGIGVLLTVELLNKNTPAAQTQTLPFTLSSKVYACGGGCRSFCGKYTYDSYGNKGCAYTVQVCDPACPANVPPPPPPSGGGSTQCAGWCGGCVSTCNVNASNCASLLAANCYQSAGVTRTVTSVTAQAPPNVTVGQTSVRTTTGGTFVQTGSGIISNGYIVNTLGKCTTPGTGGCSLSGTISTLNCTGATCTVPNISGLTSVVCYCSGGLSGGVCLQSCIPITVQPGQKIDFSTYIQNGCGAIQVDFDTSAPAGTGNAGAATINTGKTCGAAAPPAPSSSTSTSTQVSPLNTGNNACGQPCQTTVDCRAPANGGTAICRNGICENAACAPGKTLPGANCDCGTAGRVCGQTCSASLGLCAPGQGECAYTDGPSCGNPISGTYCTGTLNGYTKKNCVARDQGNFYLIGPNGKTTGFTPTELTASCTGQCTRIKVYKGTVAVVPSTLVPGDNVTLAVAGTDATKGRIRVNGAAFVETTTKNTNGEFTVPFTVPSGITSFTIEAEVFTNGQWR